MIPLNIQGNFLVVLILFLYLRSTESNKYLFIWFFAFLILTLLRDVMLIFYRKKRRDNIRPYYVIHLVTLSLSALLWGFSGFIIFTGDLTANTVISVTVVGVVMAAITSLAGDKKSLFSYIALSILPFAVRMILMTGEHYRILGILLFLFLILITYIAVRINNLVSSNLNIREENLLIIDELTEGERRYRAIFEQAPAGIFYYDENLVIDECNDDFAVFLGTDKKKLIHFDMKVLNNKKMLETLKAPFKGETGLYEGDYETYISGENLWITLKCSLLAVEEGKKDRAIGIMQNRSKMHKIEEKIAHMAYHDSLTGLPNRVLLKDRIHQAVISSERLSYFGAVLFLDLDNFKTINDSLGHDVGDSLLVAAARRIRSLLRDVDTVSRVGGDEFVIVLPKLHKSEGASMSAAGLVADKIHLTLTEPFILLGKTLYTSTSIGIALFSGSGSDTDRLLKESDTAMYEAKREGRGRTHFYNIEMNRQMRERLNMENNLRNALTNQELILHFQPIIERKEKKERISGAETLLRWKYGDNEFISPVEFIPLAEETGLIHEIGEWLLNEACRNLSEWRKSPETDLDYLSVNISVQQLEQKNFAPLVLEILGKFDIPPHILVLEITENVFVDSFDKVSETMAILKRKGVRFALDDFGTGYSSLTYLKELELDIIKIDRAFIKDICEDNRDAVLVRAVQTIAENFQIKVIAEGVEEKTQIELLDRIGCPNLQGFFYSRPLSSEDFVRFKMDFNSRD